MDTLSRPGLPSCWRDRFAFGSLFQARFSFLTTRRWLLGGVGLGDGRVFGAFLAEEFFLGGTFIVFVAVEPFVDGLTHDAVASMVLRRVGMWDAGTRQMGL